MGVLTEALLGMLKNEWGFQSSTSRHGGTDLMPEEGEEEGEKVSILYIEAWGY